MTFIFIISVQLIAASAVDDIRNAKRERSESLELLSAAALSQIDSQRAGWLSTLDRRMLAWGAFSLDPEYHRLSQDLMRNGGFSSTEEMVQDVFQHNAAVLAILSDYLADGDIFSSLSSFASTQPSWIRSTLKATVESYTPGIGKCLFKILPNGLRSNYDTFFTHLPGNELKKSDAYPLGYFTSDGTWTEDEAHSSTSRRLRMVFSHTGERRFLDLEEGCAAELAPDVNIRLIPELRIALQYDSRRLLLWQELAESPQTLLETVDELFIAHLSYSPASGLVYFRAGDGYTYGSFILPGNASGPILELHQRPFLWVDGDILDFRFFDEAPMFKGAERGSRYPDKPVIDDLRIVQVNEGLAVVDTMKDRVVKFFQFECTLLNPRLDALRGDREDLLREICASSRFDLIEKFIHGRPYTDLDLIELLSQI